MVSGWIVLLVTLNIGNTAISVERYATAGTFDYKSKCDGFISFHELKNAVCWKDGETTLLRAYGFEMRNGEK